jgi:hypothetical protein
MTDVLHKIICKIFSPKKEKKLVTFFKIVENQTPLGYNYKYTIQGGLCIAIPQLLKI